MLFGPPALLSVITLLSPGPPLSAAAAQTNPLTSTCADETIVDVGCDPSDLAACERHCGLFDSPYLLDKCCAHAGVMAQVLAFEESAAWVPRIAEYGRCTGASIRMKYVAGGEDAMAAALLDDVGANADATTGQGIYDAYVVQAPWLPPVFEGLRSLTPFIKRDNDYIDFLDINQASRAAVSFEGEVRALPLDADYISLGWRQDIFENEQIKSEYLANWREELTVPDTIEELVFVSERLNGRHDYNNDGVMDWGFCLTPQTNYFQAFLAPVLQTHLNECEEDGRGGYVCRGSDTGQNIHFDADNFDALVDTEGYRYAVELYSRFVLASNCQDQIPRGEKCDRKTAFPTGRCAGVISMPGTMTQLLKEEGKYSPPREKRMDEVLGDGEHWGRRKVFPGSRKVVDWDREGRPLVDCAGAACPLARDGVNYAPFFAEGGESYALNGRQSKPAATAAVWDMFTWLSTLPAGEVPLSGVYRKSQLTDEATAQLAEQWNNTVMAQDLNDVLLEYFKDEEEGGNAVQDLFLVGFPQYNAALDTALHTNFILENVENGGLFNMEDIKKSIDPVRNKKEFDQRYEHFVKSLTQKYEEVHAMQDGGAIRQLSLWRGALDIRPAKSEEELCQDLLATDHASFDKLDCINVVILKDLCQSQEADVEEYQPGACREGDGFSAIIIAVLCGIVGAGVVMGLAYYFYNRYRNYQRIRAAHEQQMESTLNSAWSAIHSLDYPLHLIQGNKFVEEGKLMRHEVLRNTHKLTVLDSLPDVDAFVAAGKHVIFFSHQWTSFTAPDPSGHQYIAMCHAAKDLAKQKGWDASLNDVFIWVDYSSIPQVNTSIQNLAVRSLAAYAASATYFVIVAPDAPHAELHDTCDLDTYQKRMWCRAEQLCHSMRNGTEGMYLAVDDASPIVPVESDFFNESLHVFEGELTCCRLEHKGMGACDRQSLVIPFLGLYGVLSRAAHKTVDDGNEDALASVNAFLNEIEENQDVIFPPTFQRTMWRKDKRVTEEVTLFGDLIDRMRAKVKCGADFGTEEGTDGTASTNSNSEIVLRHGAPGFLRHGASVGIETAARTSK